MEFGGDGVEPGVLGSFGHDCLDRLDLSVDRLKL
jgi:hypothetical protein